MSRVTQLIRKHRIAAIVVLIVFLAIVVIVPLVTYREVQAQRRLSDGILPTAAEVQAAPHYKRVLILAVDGAGDYFSQCDTPNFDRIFAAGSVTYEGWSQYPTVSGPNWTSALHGVRYQLHHITNNKAEKKYSVNPLYPSIFAVYAAAHPSAKYVSVSSWKTLNIGIVPDIAGMTKISAEDAVKEDKNQHGLDFDRYTTAQAIAYIQMNEPAIALAHYDHVDHVGHQYGYASPQYKTAVQSVDALIGEIYNAYCNRGWQNDTLFVLLSDHGHTYKGGHGGNSEQETRITLAVAGGLGDIIAGTPGKVATQDLASVVTYALGEVQPDTWESRVPYNMFNTLQRE